MNRQDIYCITENHCWPGASGAARGQVSRWRVRHDVLVDISANAVVSYVDRAVEQMTAIVTELGDKLANRKPALPGANSPYAILRHCLGVMEFWGGEVVAGREVIRDRPAEFRAHGPVAGLAAAAGKARGQFRADAAAADFAGPPRGGAGHQKYPGELEFTSQGHALLHVLEEVTQHLGQMEVTRDVLRLS
jgi:hypothetical protein